MGCSSAASFREYPTREGPLRPRRGLGAARAARSLNQGWRRQTAMSRLPPNPALKRLEVLIGDWEVEVPQFPGPRGRATFEWLEDGAYLSLSHKRRAFGR